MAREREKSKFYNLSLTWFPVWIPREKTHVFARKIRSPHNGCEDLFFPLKVSLGTTHINRKLFIQATHHQKYGLWMWSWGLVAADTFLTSFYDKPSTFCRRLPSYQKKSFWKLLLSYLLSPHAIQHLSYPCDAFFRSQSSLMSWRPPSRRG